MKVTITQGGIYCCDACALQVYEDLGRLPDDVVRVPMVMGTIDPLNNLLLERACCDTCGNNLRDLVRTLQTP